MSCLDENTIVAFFTAPTSAGLTARVDAHTATCAACRALLAAYAEMARAQATEPLWPSVLRRAPSPNASDAVNAVNATEARGPAPPPG